MVAISQSNKKIPWSHATFKGHQTKSIVLIVSTEYFFLIQA